MSDTTVAPPATRWPAALAIRNRTAAVLLGLFGLLAAVNLVGGAAAAGTGGVRLSDVFTKPLLMPVLAGFAVAAARPGRASRLAVCGLLLGGLGDVALLGHGTWFLVGMGAFALGHACYLSAFLRRGAVARLRRRWWIPVGYLAVWAGLIALSWPGLDGGLRVPVLGYSLLLTAMAAAAAGTGRVAAAGGALFLISDGTLALGMAGVDFPGRGAVVMPTYLAAQLLIALALLATAPPAPVAPERGSAVA
jgi:uncharacterized membrane protein YhhN